MPRPSNIPDRWMDYLPVGKQIEGTRFICFKCPLRPCVNEDVDEQNRLDYDGLLSKIPNLGLIIDLTDTYRYYDPQVFEKKGLFYIKIRIPGKCIPPKDLAEQFNRTVREYLRSSESKDKLIGVHCTHGVNRTGYLVCNYMISVMTLSAEEALKKFNTARGHRLERENYIEALYELETANNKKRSIQKTRSNSSERRRSRSTERKRAGHVNVNEERKRSNQRIASNSSERRRSCSNEKVRHVNEERKRSIQKTTRNSTEKHRSRSTERKSARHVNEYEERKRSNQRTASNSSERRRSRSTEKVRHLNVNDYEDRWNSTSSRRNSRHNKDRRANYSGRSSARSKPNETRDSFERRTTSSKQRNADDYRNARNEQSRSYRSGSDKMTWHRK